MYSTFDGPFIRYCSRKAKRDGLCRQHWCKRNPTKEW